MIENLELDDRPLGDLQRLLAVCARYGFNESFSPHRALLVKVQVEVGELPTPISALKSIDFCYVIR